MTEPGILLSECEEASSIRVGPSALDKHMEMVRHEAVRDYFDTCRLAGTQNLQQCALDDIAIAKQRLALKAAPCEEIPVPANVIEALERLRMSGEHPPDEAGIRPRRSG